MRHFTFGNRRWAWMTTVFAAAASTDRALALDASDILIFSKDPVILRPQLELSETYNNNIFFRPTDLVGDFISTVSPGLNLQVGKLEGNFIAADYLFDNVFYADNAAQNSQQHRLGLRDKFEFKRITIEGRDQIDFLSSILGGGFSLGGVRVDRTVYSDNYTIRYAISPKTGVYLQGSHDAADYANNVPLFDANTLTGTAGFSYQAFPKTSFFGEVYYGQTGTDPNGPLTVKPPHASFLGGFLGANGNFTEKLSGSVKAGYETREFSDPTTAGTSLPVVEASVTQRFSEKTSMALSYSRHGYVSVQFVKQSYAANVMNFSMTQVIGTTGKLRSTLGGIYTMYEYEQVGTIPRRTDQMYSAYLRLTYDLRLWLKANLGYEFESFGTDVGGKKVGVIDYNVNRVTLGLAIGY